MKPAAKTMQRHQRVHFQFNKRTCLVTTAILHIKRQRTRCNHMTKRFFRQVLLALRQFAIELSAGRSHLWPKRARFLDKLTTQAGVFVVCCRLQTARSTKATPSLLRFELLVRFGFCMTGSEASHKLDRVVDRSNLKTRMCAGTCHPRGASTQIGLQPTSWTRQARRQTRDNCE